MSDTLPSANMNMPVPVVGVDAGPDYAENLNACLGILDIHDHTSGSGVPITPDAMDINSDLSMGENDLTTARSVRFFPQTVALSNPTDLGCLYEVTNDLYYNDGVGNQVRITQSGGVAGSPGSIANLTSPASASFVSADATFVFESDTNVPGNLDGGSVLLRNLSANSKALTLEPPAAMGADYTVILPALPVSTSAVNITSGGTMGTITYDAIGQAMSSTGANAIAATRTRTTGTTVAAGGVAISASSASFASSSTSFVDVTNLSVTITTSGRPVQVFLVGTSTGAKLTAAAFTSAAESSFQFVRDVTSLGSYSLQTTVTGYGSPVSVGVPASVMQTLDAVGAGTYTYKLQGKVVTGSSFSAVNCILVAYEV